MTTPHLAARFDMVTEIAQHSAGLAKAAEANLNAPVEHCPGWTVADLVWHLTGVHWFWSTIVAGLLRAPPEDEQRPDRPDPDQLVSRFSAGAEHLARVLAAADPAAPCWTWARTQQNAGFVRRHQVQEAAVHHWDAERAAGSDIALGTAMSVDAIDEFLTFSMSTVDDHPEVPLPNLDGPLVLAASDAGLDWTVTDDSLPGTVTFSTGTADLGRPRVTGTASDLLLWLYGRVPLPVTAGGSDSQPAAEQLASRFRALAFTD
ncbi:MAG: maleylpyruvate isomerase family mycothiol-dependent enzyme [Jatrophihabitantaceae bacterium]